MTTQQEFVPLLPPRKTAAEVASFVGSVVALLVMAFCFLFAFDEAAFRTSFFATRDFNRFEHESSAGSTAKSVEHIAEHWPASNAAAWMAVACLCWISFTLERIYLQLKR